MQYFFEVKFSLPSCFTVSKSASLSWSTISQSFPLCQICQGSCQTASHQGWFWLLIEKLYLLDENAQRSMALTRSTHLTVADLGFFKEGFRKVRTYKRPKNFAELRPLLVKNRAFFWYVCWLGDPVCTALRGWLHISSPALIMPGCDCHNYRQGIPTLIFC